MFELVAFIRQNVPPHIRTDLNVGMINVLFAPIVSLLTAIEATRQKMLYEAQATGQVIVLEELCNQAVYGANLPGAIYLLDSNANSVDFQVVIPSNMPDNLRSNIRGVLDKYKQAGKRYVFIDDLAWSTPTPLPPTDPGSFNLTWEDSYPLLTSDGFISFAIKQTGQFSVTLSEDGNSAYDIAAYNFVAGHPEKLSAPSPTAKYVLTVGNLSATLVRQPVVVIPVISKIAFIRSGTLVMLVALVDQGDVQMKLVGRDGTVRADNYGDAAVWGSTVDGVDYNRRGLFYDVPDGKYTAYYRVKGQTAEKTLSIDFTAPNQNPVVANPIQDQTGRVGVPFVFQIANTAFADPDGSIVKVETTGWPAGISYDVSSRTASGTPTTAGTYTITATGTDNSGASISDQFQVTILPATVTPPPPQGSTGTPFSVTTNPPALINQFVVPQPSSDPDVLNIVLDHYDQATGLVYYKNIANPTPKQDWIWKLEFEGQLLTFAEFAAAPHLPRRPCEVRPFLVNPGFALDQQRRNRDNYYVAVQVVNYI